MELPQSKHYEIVVSYSEEHKRDVYWARNKSTGVLEIPFVIIADASIILSDLEDYYKDANPSKKPSIVPFSKLN